MKWTNILSICWIIQRKFGMWLRLWIIQYKLCVIISLNEIVSRLFRSVRLFKINLRQFISSALMLNKQYSSLRSLNNLKKINLKKKHANYYYGFSSVFRSDYFVFNWILSLWHLQMTKTICPVIWQQDPKMALHVKYTSKV